MKSAPRKVFVNNSVLYSISTPWPLCSPTQLLNTSSQPITRLQLNAFRHVDVIKVTRWSLNQKKESRFKWLWMWMVGGLSISLTLTLRDLTTILSKVYRDGLKKKKYPGSYSCVDEEGLLLRSLKMGRLVPLTQVTSCPIQRIQNSMSEGTTGPTWKMMSSNPRPFQIHSCHLTWPVIVGIHCVSIFIFITTFESVVL